MPFAHRRPETVLYIMHLQLRKGIIVRNAAVLANLEPGRMVALHERAPVPEGVSRRRGIVSLAFVVPGAFAVSHADDIEG